MCIRDRNKGTVLIEFAFILPIILILTFSVIEYYRYLLTLQKVNKISSYISEAITMSLPLSQFNEKDFERACQPAGDGVTCTASGMSGKTINDYIIDQGFLNNYTIDRIMRESYRMLDHIADGKYSQTQSSLEAQISFQNSNPDFFGDKYWYCGYIINRDSNYGANFNPAGGSTSFAGNVYPIYHFGTRGKVNTDDCEMVAYKEQVSRNLVTNVLGDGNSMLELVINFRHETISPIGDFFRAVGIISLDGEVVKKRIFFPFRNAGTNCIAGGHFVGTSNSNNKVSLYQGSNPDSGNKGWRIINGQPLSKVGLAYYDPRTKKFKRSRNPANPESSLSCN